MVTQTERLAILARRFDLVQDYGALDVERMDLHTHLHALRTAWSVTMPADGGRGGAVMAAPLTTAERHALACDLKLLFGRLRDIALHAEDLARTADAVVQALSESEDQLSGVATQDAPVASLCTGGKAAYGARSQARIRRPAQNAGDGLEV